jgi:uncharacterized protein YndB with AHSA1/START domain
MIKITAHINASMQNVWEKWTTSEHICNWNFAADDWYCPAARIDLVVGGSFTFTMAARDDMQRMGWQMILDRFKNYVESASS